MRSGRGSQRDLGCQPLALASTLACHCGVAAAAAAPNRREKFALGGNARTMRLATSPARRPRW